MTSLPIDFSDVHPHRAGLQKVIRRIYGCRPIILRGLEAASGIRRELRPRRLCRNIILRPFDVTQDKLLRRIC